MSLTIKTIGLILAIITINLPVRALDGAGDYETLDRYSSSYNIDTISVQIRFRFDDTMVLRDFKDNNIGLSRLKSAMKEINNIDSITIVGFTSPDGLVAYNLSLAQKRAESMRSYLYWRYPATRYVPIRIRIEQNMVDTLLEYINQDNNIPSRDKVLEILSDESRSIENRIANIQLDLAESYDYINHKIFPQMRIIVSYILYHKAPIATSKEMFSKCADTSLVTIRDTQGVEVETKSSTKVDSSTVVSIPLSTESDTQSNSFISVPNTVYTPISGIRKPLFALKTNLLFDAMTVLNIGIEVPIGKRWSIAGEWMFPWWIWDSKQHAIQVLSGNIEGKYWLGDRDIRPNGKQREQLTGWFVGLYAGGGYYDLEWKRMGYQGEFFIAAGVSGGYAHTINKRGNLRMEYSLGVGYMQTNYRKYEAKIGSDEEWHLYRRNDGKYNWLGPTSAKVSLVWMLDYKFKKEWLK